MPGLHTFRVRCHSLSGQLMPAKVPLWLSAKTTKTETIVSPGGTWKGTFCMGKTELISVQLCENKWSKPECWWTQSCKTLRHSWLQVKGAAKRTVPPVQNECPQKMEGKKLVLYYFIRYYSFILPFVILEQPVFLGSLHLHPSFFSKSSFSALEAVSGNRVLPLEKVVQGLKRMCMWHWWHSTSLLHKHGSALF